VELDPVRGSEANKTRPCVIVSGDSSNLSVAQHSRGLVTVVPLTSNIRRVLPFQVFIPVDEGNGLSADSKAQAEQIRAVDFERFVTRIGVLRAEHLAAIDAAILIHLDLA
jgi:mRNA interferase MazF